MYTGLLFDGRLHPEDITACIIYLASSGQLTIRKIDGKVLFFFEVDDYEIILHTDVASFENPFQKEVLKLLFGESGTTGDTVTLSKLKTNHTQQQENQRILSKLKKDLEKDLVASGFFQSNIPIHFLVGGIVGVAFVAFFLGALFITIVPGIGIILGIAAIASFAILAFAYRRRTQKGYEALDYLQGFRQFLSVTEAERYTFHNAPKKSPEQFMEYLPYAIAFGVEKEWADVFKDVTIPNPGWYEGGNVSSFSAVNLTTSLSAFNTAFQSSSGSSASSGGGSTGGGAGGGGGGSW
jgi:uncharacterized membrane protein